MMRYCFPSAADFASLRAGVREVLGGLCPAAAQLLFVALNEAVNNAFLHGHAETTGRGVEVEISASLTEICIRVSHSGTGLSPASISPALPDELEDHGRGLAIIRLCTDYAEFDEAGRALIMRKRID